MDNIFKPTGPLKSSKPDAGGAALRSTPVFGIVKNNIDPTRAGRIQVYISDIGTEDPENPEGWATVSYMSPFYGLVASKSGDTGYGSFATNSISYGMWNSPPDIGTRVICLFINGDPNYGFYIGCVPEPEALQMVPAIGATSNIIPNTTGEANGYAGAEQLPVTNINTNNKSITDGPNFLNEPKPVHSYAASILSQQGLIRDTIRGPITTSAQRETPSRVGWGISTPGRPIYSGGYTDESLSSAILGGDSIDPSQLEVIARRSGHTFIMDDGDLIGRDQLVRIRSAAGHQILMSDDGQTLFIIHSNGQSYIELGKEGTVDLYSTNSFNVRTQGDLNLHADNNINIHSAKKLNIQAEEININSEKSTSHKIGQNYTVYTMGTYTHKVDGSMSMASSGEASFASSGTTYINGSRINLNTGSSSITPQTVPPIPVVAHTDTLFDSTKGYAAAPGMLQSITSRAPAHSPWVNANQGVDVKTSTSASKNLPSAPTEVVKQTTNVAQQNPTDQPVTVAGISTVPSVTPASASLDSNTTGAIIGAMAKNAATGPLAAAVQQGAAVVNTTNGKVAAIGNMAQTPKQLESSGIIKPGAAKLVEGMVGSGIPINKALTNNLFTGKLGAVNLQAYVNNIQSQVAAQITNIQKSQTALASAGVLTGKESPTAIAGVITAGVTSGINATLTQMKNSSIVNSATGVAPLAGVSGNVTRMISSGTIAAGIAQTSMGGLSSISGAVNAVSKAENTLGTPPSAKGASAAAFSSITNSWKPLLVGVPQDLQAIARAGAALGEAISSGKASPQLIANRVGAVANAAGARGAGQLSSSIGSLISTATSAASGNITSPTEIIKLANKTLGSVGQIGSALGDKSLSKTTSQISGVLTNSNNILNAVNRIDNATNVGQVLSGASSAINSINRIGATFGVSSKSSGLINLPGGQLSAASIVNQALGKVDLPGLPGLKQVINATLTSTINNIPVNKGLVSNSISAIQSKTSNLQSLALSGLSPAAAAQLTSAISSLSSAGSTPIKLPTVGVNTFDRSEMTSQIDSLLGDNRIPRPNFGTPSSTSIANIEALKEQNILFTEKQKEISSLQDQWTTARQNYNKLVSTLPKGDPALETAKQEWLALGDALRQATEELKKLMGYK